MKTNAVYFGGSRHPQNTNRSQIAAVVAAVVAGGQSVHVGCQFGADQAVIENTPPHHLTAFAVAGMGEIPNHLQIARVNGGRVISCAGGTSAPVPARYLLRSIAAFQGCESAVFFSPGAGSLAVARECVRAGLPVFAFQQEPPARIPSTAGSWSQSSFMGFSCWQWSAPKQASLF